MLIPVQIRYCKSNSNSSMTDMRWKTKIITVKIHKTDKNLLQDRLLSDEAQADENIFMYNVCWRPKLDMNESLYTVRIGYHEYVIIWFEDNWILCKLKWFLQIWDGSRKSNSSFFGIDDWFEIIDRHWWTWSTW